MQRKCSSPSRSWPSPGIAWLPDLGRQTLIQAFGARPSRFRLLKQCLEEAGTRAGDLVVEIGCAYGAGSFFMTDTFGCRVLGVDMDRDLITCAQETLRQEPRAHVSFAVGRAEYLPLDREQADVVVSEAAFSLITDKDGAAIEYRRVLNPRGRVIVIDFMLRGSVDEHVRQKMEYIPCFAGVQSMEAYRDVFEQAGFVTRAAVDESKELIATSLWLSKVYRTKPDDLSRTFAHLLGCRPAEGGNRRDEAACRQFFRQARLGYGRMIFEKEH